MGAAWGRGPRGSRFPGCPPTGAWRGRRRLAGSCYRRRARPVTRCGGRRCRRYRLAGADAEDAGQAVWLQLVNHIGRIRDPAALPGWLATTTRRECGRIVRAARRTAHRGGHVLDAEDVPDEQAAMADDQLLAGERHAALREALAGLLPACQHLITLLAEDPPLPYAQISARLGIPVGSIGPTRRRCLDKLRRHPAITGLTGAEPSA